MKQLSDGCFLKRWMESCLTDAALPFIAGQWLLYCFLFIFLTVIYVIFQSIFILLHICLLTLITLNVEAMHFIKTCSIYIIPLANEIEGNIETTLRKYSRPVFALFKLALKSIEPEFWSFMFSYLVNSQGLIINESTPLPTPEKLLSGRQPMLVVCWILAHTRWTGS